MRKIILFIGLCFMTIIASAQLTATGDYKLEREITSNKDTVQVFIFNGIKLDTEIIYTGTGTSKWYKFSDLQTPYTSVLPEDATGYVLDVDGKRTTIWVIDLKKYMPVSISVENSPDTQCEEVKINAVVPELSYFTLDGISHNLPRNFTISYKTMLWNADTAAWSTITTSQPITFPNTETTVPAPLCDTYFTLSGDQYFTDSIKSTLYSTVAVKCHATSIVTIRTEINEAERPYDASIISGSAPLDIQFLSNVNKTDGTSYVWSIYKGEQFVIERTEKDHRYTFTEAGTFKVKLDTKNAYCSDSGIITITVTESALFVPNVFTPNGDEFNNEFRVAYKSIISFQCWVYNRWGRKVFYWTDPQKGWDGNINEKKAAAGAYFYVINAVGSDGIKYKLKGDINLLRGKE